MRLAIVGSRIFHESGYEEDYAEAENWLVKIVLKYKPEVIISGGAVGVDRMAKIIAKNLHFPYREFPPKTRNWAGYKARDKQIAEDCTHLIAVIHRDSKSYGAGWTADYAESIGKQVYRKVI